MKKLKNQQIIFLITIKIESSKQLICNSVLSRFLETEKDLQ